MRWELNDAGHRPRMLVAVAREGHCLNDLLYRWQQRRDRRRDRRRRIRPPRLRGARHRLRRSVPPAAGRRPGEGHARRAAGAGDARSRSSSWCSRATCRCCRARVPRTRRPRHQHPPFVPAVVQGRASLRAGARPWREADRRDGALRDRPSSTRDRSSSRTSPASITPTAWRSLPASGGTSSASRWRGRCAGTSSTGCCCTATERSSSAEPL